VWPLKPSVALHHQITIKKTKMKKIIFALQIFALAAAFPLYIISELNCTSAPLPLKEKPSGVIEKPELTVSKTSTATTLDFDSQYLFFISN